MGILGYGYRAMVGSIVRNPTGAAGFVVFGLGFVLVAANAVFSQAQFHPAPLWSGTERTGSGIFADKTASIPKPASITRSVLTQRISLSNVPVPTAKPAAKPQSVKPKSAKPELVREMQSELAEIGLYEGKVDGIYGSATKQAIINYQTSAGMLPDGMASYELLRSLKATAAVSRNRREETVKPVASVAIKTVQSSDFDRNTVVRIQSGLKEKFGENEIAVDGVLGAQTREAIQRFQKFFDLDANGEIDRKTMEKMLSAGIITAI